MTHDDLMVSIGIEVHIQMKTVSKLFCLCLGSADEDHAILKKPNANICPICTASPGSLPILNQEAVHKGVKASLALNCKVNRVSAFDRKHYSYPDLPKNYQITQLFTPIAQHGFVYLEKEKKKIRINRVHIEEDAGKLLHPEQSSKSEYSLVDLNRAGMPLIEVVSEPDMNSEEEAYEYLKIIKVIMQYSDISNCDMEKGSLRCDINISIKKKSDEKLGTKVEIKNMNSFRGVKNAIIYEVDRQKSIYTSGTIQQETRLWNADLKKTMIMRGKEESKDYRYFPEPDINSLILSEELIKQIQDSIPELSVAKRIRFMQQYQLSEYDANILTSRKDLAQFYEQVATHVYSQLDNQEKTNALQQIYKLVSNWMLRELITYLNTEKKNIDEGSTIKVENFSKLILLLLRKKIFNPFGRKLFSIMWETGKCPSQIMKEKGTQQISDHQEIEKFIIDAIAKNQKAVQEYKNGKKKAISALIGYVMRSSAGQANPSTINKLLVEKLNQK